MEYVWFLGITGCTFNPLERVNFGAPRTEGKPFRYTTKRVCNMKDFLMILPLANIVFVKIEDRFNLLITPF
ncbi:hypothetical protein ALC57_14008 [Trachymyrmex cornetzi]|uniref:Uncharacterized protein n=1 Tax=Trachymyrmex cornetzi TaxID=471704 RepID=A0A195DN59_9HYME|nr:hypothetical protein ALC57_14008 [Trachymyrmex cornetzi]